MAPRKGFSLIEIALAIAVGLMVLGASVYAFQQTTASSKLAQAKTMVGTIQGNLATDKFRLGTPVPLAATPSPYSSSFGLLLNTDSVGKPYYPNSSPGVFPADPVQGQNAILPFDSAASPVALATNAPTPQWDNPVFLSPGPSPGYGKGGWLYDPATGAFRANLSNQDYPDQRPAAW